MIQTRKTDEHEEAELQFWKVECRWVLKAERKKKPKKTNNHQSCCMQLLMCLRTAGCLRGLTFLVVPQFGRHTIKRTVVVRLWGGSRVTVRSEGRAWTVLGWWRIYLPAGSGWTAGWSERRRALTICPSGCRGRWSRARLRWGGNMVWQTLRVGPGMGNRQETPERGGTWGPRTPEQVRQSRV